MTKPLMWIKYKPKSLWQRIKRWVRWLFGIKDPSIATGTITFSSEDMVKPDNGIIDITAPDGNTFGEVMDIINDWGKKPTKKVKRRRKK